MGDLSRRLQKEQALLRPGEIDSTPTRAGNDRIVVIFRAECQQRQLEATTPSELSVALGGGAAGAIQDRRDVAQKLNPGRRRRSWRDGRLHCLLLRDRW